ncbi:MAG TPA: hypothetical protein VHC97_23400 [Thermoanaerobaculia bacterium]|nr:hypothetical protein [Thermoanaerobaculia bacterium]
MARNAGIPLSGLRKLAMVSVIFILTLFILTPPRPSTAGSIYAEYFVQYFYADPYYSELVGQCVRNDCTMYYDCWGQWGPYNQIYSYQICCDC